MSNIIAINGSPKAKDSVSGMFIGQMETILGTEFTIYQATKLIQQEDISETLSDILKADVLLFVFPLYVDSLPAPLIKLLTLLESSAAGTGKQHPMVYAVCNCGFYEAEHTRLALDMIRNFSDRAGLAWGYGIGVGCGGFLYSQRRKMPKGPAANVYAALCALGKAIQDGGSEEQNVFVTPKMPRFLYKFVGNLSWRQAARKYGTKKSLKAKPHLES